MKLMWDKSKHVEFNLSKKIVLNVVSAYKIDAKNSSVRWPATSFITNWNYYLGILFQYIMFQFDTKVYFCL